MDRNAYHLEYNPQTRVDIEELTKTLEEKSHSIEENNPGRLEEVDGATFYLDSGEVYLETEQNRFSDEIERVTILGDVPAMEEIPSYLLEENDDAQKVPLT